MNRALTIVNFIGVLALAGLCVVQWRANDRLGLRGDDLERTRQEQAARIVEQEKTLKGNAADLDDFRRKLEHAEADAKDAQRKLALADARMKQMEADRDRNKAALEKWVAAVSQRDQALRRIDQQFQATDAKRVEAVKKFNDLASKYDTVVKELNAASARAGGGH